MSDSTTLIQQIVAGANADVRVNENFDAASPAMMFGRRAAATTGLTWAYYGGKWPINGVPTAIANGTVTLTASTTNYVGITQAGVVTASATADPLHTPLYTVVTGASTVTSYIDNRGPMRPYGIGTQAMADANQTITQALALCDSLTTTGALTGTRNLVVPLVRRAWTVRNNCTGGSVQVIGATGTGVTIAAGSVALVECDGTNVLAATSSGGSGDVATDAIWDAAGDLAVGSGANTASRLAKGTALQVLRVNAGATALEWATPSTAASQCIPIACSDETTALTVGTAKVTFRMPYAFTLTAVRASVTTAPTGGTLLTVDINDSGTTILSTKLTFDASEKTTTTATTAAVISDTALADDAEITIDIDAVGSTVAGAGLKVYLIGVIA
jgi:hypothetical protein